MEDMDEMRSAKGTAADFSGWQVNNGFGTIKKQPKVTSTERVIEPELEPESEINEPEGFINKSKQRAERLKELEEEQARLKAEEDEQKIEEQPAEEKRPTPNTFNINIKSLGEIKELAKRLLPTIDKIKTDEYSIACELAINLAMTFEGLWEQKTGGIDVKEE